MNCAYGISMIKFEFNNKWLIGSDSCPLASLVERGGCTRSLRSLRLPRLCRGRRTPFPSSRRGKVLILNPAHLPNSKPGGEGRIRTSEGIANRFTVCPLWPLGNLSDSKPSFFIECFLLVKKKTGKSMSYISGIMNIRILI
jgi:hypothetical protein